jgi:hypothetical protein
MHLKRIVFPCLVWLLLASTGFCWVGSFRSAASGNLFYGDFDNDLDPVYIWDNDGYRLYSTLSNLTTTNDRFGSNLNDGVYLFGISGGFRLPEFGDWRSRTMMLVQLADSRADATSGLDIDFDGTNDITGQGFLAGEYVQYHDLNDDNIFDTRAIYRSSADNYNLLKRRDWNIVHSYKRGETAFGFSFIHLGYGNNCRENNRHVGMFTFLVPARSYSYSNSLIQTDLSTQAVLETRTETGDFLNTYQTPANIIWFSLETPFYMIPESEFRFDISLNMLKNQFSVDDRFELFRDVSSSGITDISTRVESIEIDSTLDGYVVTPMIRLTKHWHEHSYSWFDLAVGLGSFDANKIFADNYNSDIRLTNTSGNVAVTTQNFDDLVDQSGDTKHKKIGVYHKTVVDFTESFSFAIGLDYLYSTDKTDWDATYSTTNILDYNNGNGIGDPGDSTYSRVTSNVVNLIDESKTTAVSLPVALEYSLKRWTFRLAAVHTIQRRTEEIERKIEESSPAVVTIIHGDGDTTVTTEDNDFLSQGTATETHTSATNFVYGLQFKANDHLKIELLHFLGTSESGLDFLNSDFYRQLRLSLTLMF